MADSQVRALARRLQRLEQQALQRKQPTLGFSSIDDGAITAVDVDGNLQMVIGKQFDGTQTAAVVSGPTPPQPLLPYLTPKPGSLSVYWDGTFTNGGIAPMDFARVLAYAVPLAAFVDTEPLNQAIIVGEFNTAVGGEISVALAPDEYAVYLVCWTQAGKYGAASDVATATVPVPLQGEQGIPGPPGADGQTLYTWLKYADDATGSGMSDSPVGKTYMGLAYNKTTPTESTTPGDYAWSLIQGAAGAPGKGVSSTAVTYQVGSSGTTAPTGTWQSTPQATTTGQFLWTRTVTTYTDASTTTAYSVSAHGSTGATGSAGKGISSTAVTYQVGGSGTVAPTGTWLTTPQATTTGQFLWTRTITTYTDSTTSTAYSVSAHGATGAQGVPGTPGSSLYTWIKYATDASGSSMSDDPTGRPYIGMAYNKTSATESTVPTDYTWSLIQPENVPPAVPVAPILKITGMPRGIMVQITNPDPGYSYVYTITNTTGPVTASFPSTGRPLFYTETMPDGTPLSPSSDGYTFHVSATNASGTATSAESAPQPLVLNDDSTVAELGVGKLTAGDLTAAVALLGALNIGTSIEMTPEDGIVIHTPLGDTKFPADGSNPQLKGEAEVDALTVLGNMKVQGTTNEVAKGSTFDLATGTTAPKSAPVISSYWPSKAVTSPGYNDRGLARHAATGFYWSTDSFFAGYANPRIEDADSFDTTAGIDLTAARSEIANALGGVTIVGDAMFILCNAQESGYISGRYYVYRWNYSGGTWTYGSRWLYEPAAFLGTGSSYVPAIGYRPSTNQIVIAQCGGSGGAWVTAYSLTGTQASRLSIDVTDGANWNAATDFRACGYTNGDFGGERFYIASANNASVFIHDPTTLARTTEGFTVPEQGPKGVMWDDTKGIFRTLSGNKVYDHTGITASTFSVVQTWRKSDGVGPDFAQYETDKSPAANTTTFTKRAAMLVTSGPIPDDATDPNDPDSLTFYVATNDLSGANTSYKRQTVPAVGATSLTLKSIPTTGGNPPTVPNFPAATAARLKSAAADSAPLIDLRGDGAWRLGDLSGGSNGQAVGGAIVPIGAILPYAGTTAPTGFLLCNGAGFSSATYPRLAALVGDTFKVHSGTTYYVPDLGRRTMWGAMSTLAVGQNDGVTVDTDRLIGHRHTIDPVSHTGANNAPTSGTTAKVTGIGGSNAGSHDHGGQTGVATPPFMGMNFIIRAA